MAQTNMLMGQCVAILDHISAAPPPPLPLTNHGWVWSVVRWWLSKPNSTWSWLSAEWSEPATCVLFSQLPASPLYLEITSAAKWHSITCSLNTAKATLLALTRQLDMTNWVPTGRQTLDRRMGLNSIILAFPGLARKEMAWSIPLPSVPM